MSEKEYNKGCQVYEWEVKQRFAQEVRILKATIGIFLHGQKGDIMSAMSALYYRQELWGDSKIVWYADEGNFDLFKYQDIEVRKFPRGFGHPEMVREENKKNELNSKPLWQDWSPLVDENNHMNLELKHNYPSLADIDYGYFPGSHQRTPEQRHGIEYPNISKKIFGVPDDLPWHPCLSFSKEERKMANEFMNMVGEGKKILIESFAGSGQSRLNQEMIQNTMNICSEYWPGCKFIFASHKFLKDNEAFPDGLFKQPNIFSCADFTVRQCALIADKADLMISVSSGITVAASAWGIKQPPTVQYTGSNICSTQAIANGKFELVTADDKPFDKAKEEYYFSLMKLLNQHQ